MKLSISNLAWDASLDSRMYEALNEYGFHGLEIAPTRIFPQQPYSHLQQAHEWSVSLAERFGLAVPSMQSIWFGRTEMLFADEQQRILLLEYSKQAVDFAQAIGCGNLVFGSPKNRCVNSDDDYQRGVEFFTQLADYAQAHGTVIGLEANPEIYNTNYITTTKQALELIKQVDREGLRLNLDAGTMIANNEPAETLAGSVHLISHVHFSEPFLRPLTERGIHAEILRVLKSEGYDGYVSIEMGKLDSTDDILDIMRYLRNLAETEGIL